MVFPKLPVAYRFSVSTEAGNTENIQVICYILRPFLHSSPLATAKMFTRRILQVFALLLAPGLSIAQQRDNDYYQAHSSPQITELLGAVEKYHEAQGINKLRTIKYYESAWGDFNFILNYFPNHPRALLLMAELCDVWRNPKCNMGQYFAKAIQVSPENERVYLVQGIWLQKRGKVEEAIESYNKALTINPNSANAHYNLGLAYITTKRLDLANDHAQMAYGLGAMPPGLQNKLTAASAWKPLGKKPTSDEKPSEETAPVHAGAAAAGESAPTEAKDSKPPSSAAQPEEKAQQ